MHVATMPPSRFQTPAAVDGEARATLPSVPPAVCDLRLGEEGSGPQEAARLACLCLAPPLRPSLHNFTHSSSLSKENCLHPCACVLNSQQGPKPWLWLGDMNAHPTPLPR